MTRNLVFVLLTSVVLYACSTNPAETEAHKNFLAAHAAIQTQVDSLAALSQEMAGFHQELEAAVSNTEAPDSMMVALKGAHQKLVEENNAVLSQMQGLLTSGQETAAKHAAGELQEADLLTAMEKMNTDFEAAVKTQRDVLDQSQKLQEKVNMMMQATEETKAQ